MKQLSDLIVTPKRAKPPSQPTRKQQKLMAVAAQIRQDRPDNGDMAFMARQLVQCTLPHRNPGKVEVWQRRNGALTLSIRSGWDNKNNKEFGYPFGSIPRLLLFWITTEAQRTKSRRLNLGTNLAAFMREVGLNPDNGTGVRGDRPRLQDQMMRLFQATISFQQSLAHAGTAHGTSWLNMQVAPVGELWWDPKRPEQETLWDSWIQLGSEFYEAITQSTVPIDIRVLKALKQSPLQLDLYAWSAYMADRTNRTQKPCFVPWMGLIAQLGCDYDTKNIRLVRQKLKAAFNEVAMGFDGGIKHTWTTQGITFYPGTVLPIPPRELINA